MIMLLSSYCNQLGLGLSVALDYVLLVLPGIAAVLVDLNKFAGISQSNLGLYKDIFCNKYALVVGRLFTRVV